MSIPNSPESQADTAAKLTPFLFTSLVCIFCLWVLSLPLFPSQDGPMHKYYVHAIASILSGSHSYSAYAIRHPFPPYATHYVILLGLTRFLSFDVAEKILICVVFICTAYGFRYCARALGPTGDLLSLCMVPLVLHWSLVMGFLNYSLAIGLFFLAAGFWCRASGQPRLWLFFVLTTFLLALTHPVPLLLLIVFCSLDLFIRLFHHFAPKDYRWQFFALAVTCLSFLYPLASVDRSRSASNLLGFGLHKDALISSIALFGISPFDTRSKNLFINAYRLGLYALLLGCLVLAAEGFLHRWRTHQLRPGDSMLIMTVAILFAIPILPASMNGSDYFSQRLMIFPWLGAIAAASATTRRLAHVVTPFAIFLAVTTLLPAELFFRPSPISCLLSSTSRCRNTLRHLPSSILPCSSCARATPVGLQPLPVERCSSVAACRRRHAQQPLHGSENYAPHAGCWGRSPDRPDGFPRSGGAHH